MSALELPQEDITGMCSLLRYKGHFRFSDMYVSVVDNLAFSRTLCAKLVFTARPPTALIARRILSVRPSGVLSRRMKIQSCDFQHEVGQSF